MQSIPTETINALLNALHFSNYVRDDWAEPFLLLTEKGVISEFIPLDEAAF